jgi:hypothetical protein
MATVEEAENEAEAEHLGDAVMEDHQNDSNSE